MKQETKQEEEKDRKRPRKEAGDPFTADSGGAVNYLFLSEYEIFQLRHEPADSKAGGHADYGVLHRRGFRHLPVGDQQYHCDTVPLGMNSLYTLIHTAVVFFFGSTSLLARNTNLSFAVDLVLMAIIATVIYSYLFKKTSHNVLYVLLAGTVLSTFLPACRRR